MAYYREPKTANEKRANCDDQVTVRRKRVGRNLPDSWSDIKKPRKRTWKEFRKTQYKPITA